MVIQYTKMRKLILLIVVVFFAIRGDAQSRYCLTYKDFCKNTWHELDTVYVTRRSKNQQIWWGGNEYSLSNGNKDIDKVLKKEAFVVMQGDSLYINCRNLRFQGNGFGRGYAKVSRIGNRSLLLVNSLISKEAEDQQRAAGFMFGLAGGITAANKARKNVVCYVISNGANDKGKIDIRLVNDDLIRQMLKDQGPLLREYYEEEDESVRISASHILPILEKSGLIKNRLSK